MTDKSAEVYTVFGGEAVVSGGPIGAIASIVHVKFSLFADSQPIDTVWIIVITSI